MAIHRFFAKRRRWVKIGLLLGAAALLFACSPSGAPAPCPEVECPDLRCPDPISYENLWSSSGHADAQADAFTHWDEDDPPEVPRECAKCHSRPGFLDYLGADGTEFDRVDNAAKI